MIDKILTKRILRLYPTGNMEKPCWKALDSAVRDERLACALKSSTSECLLTWRVQPGCRPAYSIAVTEQKHPAFEIWQWMSNQKKLAWIHDHGRPYPVFWLHLSRVADYYYFHYNHWVPRGDTGYLDADFTYKPNFLWSGYEKVIISSLEEQGFSFISDELLREKTPFVMERDYDSIPEDDPRWEDGNFQPPFVPSTVYECLFSD